MKTIAKMLLAALIVSSSAFATKVPYLSAQSSSADPTAITNSYKVALYPSGMTKLNVMVEREPGLSMEISLKDAHEYLLATKYISSKEGSIHMKFDVSALGDGTYQVEVVSGSDKTIHTMKLATKSAQPTRSIALN